MQVTGIIFAAISSLFFSLYLVPRKYSQLSPLAYSAIMAAAYFLGSSLLYLVKLPSGVHEQFSLILLWSVVAGIIWAGGLTLLVTAIDYIGLARSNQWKNLQGPIGVLLAFLLFNEAAQVNVLITSLAAGSIFLAAALLSIAKPSEVSRHRNIGILLAAASSIAFGTVANINKYLSINSGVYLQQIVWSASILLTLIGLLVLRHQLETNLKLVTKKDLKLGLVAGLLYLGASWFMLESFRMIAASIAFTIIQLSGVWTILIGVLYFHELSYREHWLRLTAGLALAAVSAVLLANASL